MALKYDRNFRNWFKGRNIIGGFFPSLNWRKILSIRLLKNPRKLNYFYYSRPPNGTFMLPYPSMKIEKKTPTIIP